MCAAKHSAPVTDRLPPQNFEAEEAVLGAVLLDNAMLPAVRGIIGPEDLYSPDHRAVFGAMVALAEGGEAIDAVTLPAKLCERSDLERIGGAAYLVELAERTPSAARVESYAWLVAEAAERRRLIAAANEIAARAYDPTSTAEERAMAIGKLATARGTRRGAFDLDTAVDAALAEVDSAVAPEGGDGMATGIEVVDRNTGGMRPGQLWVVGGRPQHGKTATTVNVMDAALKRGQRVLNVRYEERAEDILMRLASLRSGIGYGDIRSGRAADNPHDVKRFKRTLVGLRAELEGRLSVLVHPTQGEIEAEVQGLRPALVVLDTLQKATHALGRVSKRHDLEVARLTAWLGRLAGRYGVAVIAVSQIGRAMLRENRRGLPRLEHLKESGAIEEDADVCVLCYWPWKESLRGDGTPAERYVLNLAKNRTAGFTGELVCRIDPETQKLGAVESRDARVFLEDVLKASSG